MDLPVEPLRHSPKIWNHVDEMRLESDLVARLARNGIRVGATPENAWPAIRTVLDRADARLRQEQMLPQGNAPLVIKLGAVEEGEAIFRYDRDNRLVGKTFPGGTKQLTLDYSFHPELGGNTNVRLALEVRHDLGTMTWERREGVIRQVPTVDRHVFEDLVAVLTLHPGESLIIGPSEQAGNDYLPGSRFFAYQQAGAQYETLLCIIPQPYQTDRTGRERT